MQLEEVFNLLTQEYTLVLATTKEDFSSVKEVRREILLPKYRNFATIEDEDLFLFNQDDRQSFIYLLQHKETKQYVGTVRIYFVNNHTAQKILPMERYTHSRQIKQLSQALPVCEISRLALSRKLVKHKNFSALQLRTYLSLGLMIATRINAFLYDYATIFSIMEPSLERLLKRQNANFKQIGEAVDYYGMRAPFTIKRKKLLHETEENVGQITRYYLKQLCQNPEPFWQFIDNNPYLERSDIQLDRICQLFKEYGEDVDLELLSGEKEIMTEV
ncbi:acyl-homoserine-lactone synthase [Sulfurovum sp.]|uniref:acyl-homoserine-lactone synthase n=1 Tax=Sulfurovum sp. TaxID=1969726 RepID=UPI0025CEAF32|nr:acyl-homoserine-lactone synthase [Sulfurovum sp.]